MKSFIVICCLLISVAGFAQQPEYPENGFTKKAEAKNLIINGLKEGKWFEYYFEGDETSTDTKAPFCILTVYKAGKPFGMRRVYYNHSSKLVEETPYDENGERNGCRKEYDGKRLLGTDSFVHGVLDGPAKEFWPDGSLKTEQNFVEDKREGVKKEYQNMILIRETSFEHDTVNGAVKEYYKSGKLWHETPFVKGLVTGTETWYYENGKVKSEIPREKNKINGTEKEYYPDGKLQREIVYNNDEVISTKNYDEKGNEIK